MIQNYDLLYLKLGEAEKVYCKEIDEDITMDLDAEGKLAGIEILSASKHINLSTLSVQPRTLSSLKTLRISKANLFCSISVQNFALKQGNGTFFLEFLL
mgnify:CR=1 FL=1